MKKLFSLLAVLICTTMLLSSTAFAADDAYTIYQKYVKKSKSISSMELSVVQKMSMMMGDQAVELTKQNASVKMITKDNKLQMEMKITDSATKETAYGYFKDNYLYERVGNEKFKIKMNADDALASSAGMDTSLPKDAFKDAKVEKVDGGVKITYKTKIADMDSSVASAFEDLDLPDNMKLSFTSMTTSLVITDDGSLKSMSSNYSVNLNDGNNTIKLKVSQNVTVKSVNSVTKIDFPTDLNTYKTLKAA